MNQEEKKGYTKQVVDMLDDIQALGTKEKKQITMEAYRYYLDVYKTENEKPKTE